MKADEMITLIQKELEENPGKTSIDISRKYYIPFKLVEIIRIRIQKGK